MRISDWSSDVCSSDLGDTFWYKQRTGRTVNAIYPLHPSSMSLEDGKWNFDTGTLRMNDIDQLALVIFKHFHPYSLTRGLSPLDTLRPTMVNARSPRTATSPFWQRGAPPGLALVQAATLC